MITTSENATQKAITRPLRSVHHTSFLWALCQEPVRSTTHRFVAVSGARLPFLENSSNDGVSSARLQRGQHGPIASLSARPLILQRHFALPGSVTWVLAA